MRYAYNAWACASCGRTPGLHRAPTLDEQLGAKGDIQLDRHLATGLDFGVADSFVPQHERRNGPKVTRKRKPKTHYDAIDAEAVKADWRIGLTYRELGVKYGVNASQAHRIVNGIKTYRHDYTDEYIAKIAADTRPNIAIAAEQGVGPEHISELRRIAKERGYYVASKVTNILLTDEQIAAIKERVAAGESYAAIGRDYGVYGGTISRIARGLRRKGGSRKRKELTDEQIAAIKADPRAVSTVAKAFGIGVSRVYDIRRGIAK